MAETAYGYRQAPVAPTPVRQYEIIVRQEPKQARMCGIGGKADRRPIDPPPIVQLRVFDTYPQDPSHAATSSNSNQFHHQPPQQALNFLQNPYYFMFASLARTESDDELHLLNDGKTRYTTGSVVSSLYHLKDTENGGEDAGFFIFPDLSVRTEGSYRLKLTLFELVGSHVQFCKFVYSRAFYVYTAKKFPGMEESTRLSMSLSDQGIKIRIRKDVRSRKRTQDDVVRGDTEIGGAGGEDDYEDDDGGDYGSGSGGAPIHPHSAESARLAITDGSGSGAANPDASGNGTGVGGTRGGGRNPRRKASTSTGGGGARFAADIVPSGKGSAKPSKRQRTQGGTVIDLSQNSVPLPPAVAVAASMSPPKRLTGTEGGQTEAHNGEPSGAGAASGSGGAPKSWDHLPEPTIKGGVPIDVQIHPATNLDPRLKHKLPSGSTTPPNGSTTAGTGNSAGDTGAGNGDAENGNGASGPAPSSGRSAAIQRHARSSSMSQPASAPAPPLQLQVSGPSQPHALAPHHQRQHSGSHASSSESYSAPSWAAPQFSPIQAQGMQSHAQQLQGGPLGHSGQPSNIPAPGYHPSAPRQNPSGMSVGPTGTGMGMALPPLQIPPQQQQQGPRGVSMNMHGMPPLQQHGYAQGYAGGSTDLTTSPEMMHPSMSMGPPPPPSHGHTPTGYGEPSIRQGMMLQPHQQNYMPPDGPPGPLYGAHGHAPMQMQGHMQQYPTHHHTYSQPPPQQQQQQQPHPMASQPPRPSPTTYAHHGHHLSDPTHSYDAYGPGTGNGRAGAVETSPRILPMGTSPRIMALGTSPGMLNMGLSPISPTRGTPLSAHPPQQQQQDMYAGGSGVGRDPYAQPGYPTRHTPQQQQHPGYGERHAQGGHSQGAYQDVGPSVYGHGHHVSGHPQSNTGYPHPHGERGWGPEEE